MSNRKWHGWSIRTASSSREIGVAPLPDRKQLCLYLLEDGSFEPLAYFRTEEKATKCMSMLDALAEGNGKR